MGIGINRVSYITDMKYISGLIREYDISKANINILLSYGKISNQTYQYLYNAPRMERQVYVGNLIKNDDSYGKIIKDGLIHYKELFYKANNIEDENIVSIHNDAVFILNKKPSVTRFDNVEFVLKGEYISFWKVFNLEMYYYYNKISQEEKLEIKGISDERLVKHEPYFIDFLKALFLERETVGIEAAISMIKMFDLNYTGKLLDVNFYREFNDKSLFNFRNGYYSEYCLPNQFDYLDTSYNIHIIRELFSILSTQYFNK